jgi:hypothetical protein
MTREHGPRKGHRWTDEELNLVCYLRHIQHWHFSKIQKANFPLLSQHAVGGAYRHLTPEDRTRRALAVASVVADCQHTREHNSPHQAQPLLQSTELGPSHLKPTNTDALLSSTGNNSARYNLRPNRPTTFAEQKSRYMIDRVRFPHFFESYRHHLKHCELPDHEYIPPSHTPSPRSSECSISVRSSQPSRASSLELFGLEPRSPKLSDYTPSVCSIRSSDTSSAEFFSTDESSRQDGFE